MSEFISAHINIIAQCIGFIAMGLGILSYQFDKRKTILTVQVFMALTWTCHFICLGVWTGMAMNILGAARFFVYSAREKKWAQHGAIPYVFAAVFLIAGIATYKDWTSLLPTASMMLASFAMWSENTKKLRTLNIPCSALWLVYDFLNGSVAGGVNEIFVLCSIFIAMLRFDRKCRSE